MRALKKSEIEQVYGGTTYVITDVRIDDNGEEYEDKSIMSDEFENEMEVYDWDEENESFEDRMDELAEEYEDDEEEDQDGYWWQ